MSEQPQAGAQAGPPAQAPAPGGGGSSLARRAVLIGAGVVALIALYLILAAFIPRWWAQRIGGQVDGSMATGIGLGLFYGFTFTLLPLLLILFALRRDRSWTARAWLAGGALVLAIPNLMTLSIVIGNGSAAHAGERILDVEGPGFRASTLIGAIAAVAAALAIGWLVDSRRRARTKAGRLDEELRARDAAAEAAADGGRDRS